MLFIVPTPVGNLEDITFRAVQVLKDVDFILAEDTRQTIKLLNHYGIQKPLYAYHKFNERKSADGFVARLQSGQKAALVSDSGTPGISDPGHILIAACIAEGIIVQTLPGATAFVPALVNSGFATDEFVFVGFLPHKKGRQTMLKKVAAEPRTQILYESPYRIVKLLEELKQHCVSERKISVSREISKYYEETLRGSAEELLAHFKLKEPKGEFVVIVSAMGTNNKTQQD